MQKVTPDERWMRRAFELALKGRGRVHPNPMVGAVLVRRSRILSEGFHAQFGGPHAEVNALRRLRRVPADAVLYVTLEPCCHTGKTPPCVDAILQKGVRQVVVAAKDQNPRVSGKGLAALRRAGVRVQAGFLAREAELMNRDFNFWVRTHRPYVTVKIGQSLDGAIATRSGDSRWITSEASRRIVMDIRAHADAILVGVNTVLRDDPRLTVRLPGYTGRQPIPVVLDPNLRTPRSARLFQFSVKARPSLPLIVISPKISKARRRTFSGRAELMEAPLDSSGRFSWQRLLETLGKRGITQLLIEGGGETIGSALDAEVVNEVHAFVAPMVIGGSRAVRWASGNGVERLVSARCFRKVWMESVGQDLHYTGIF